MTEDLLKKRIALLATLFFVVAGGAIGSGFGRSEANAESANIDDLRQKIQERNGAISALEKEIASYQQQIDETAKESSTLQSAIKALDLTGKKLAADISLTENRITSASYSIDKLALQISDKSFEVDLRKESLANTIKALNELDSVTFTERILSYDNLSDFTDVQERLGQIQSAVENNLTELIRTKTDLEGEKTELESKRVELKSLQSTLNDQKKIVDYNRKQKNTLLAETKNKEANYKKTLADKLALRDAFNKELLQFESELELAIDPSKLPPTGRGVLAWPLDSVHITQYFGMTAFAASGAYNGQGHNGVDFRAPIGTPIKAAKDGTVIGTGDTDTVCNGASYGKWVMIEHSNGLSTLYAHLSLIKVSAGENVSTGQMIGYSGMTGYSTGPHLHFTVFASDGVRIQDRKSAVCKGIYTMPIASLKAYLNPMDYL